MEYDFLSRNSDFRLSGIEISYRRTGDGKCTGILNNKKIEQFYPEREFFFPGYDSHKHLSEGFVAENFRRFWNLAFPDFTGDIYPRAYDLRHHFAWANINRWAADGMDVNVMLPYLMRYMGHQTIKQTLYYFHFVPDFYTTFQFPSARFESTAFRRSSF